MTEPLNRRRLLGVAALAAGGAPVLAACGSTDAADGSSSSPTPSATGGGTSSSGSAAGEVVAQTGDVPVGSGVFDAQRNIVVTQPEEGDFHAFSSICTHEKCPMSTIEDGLIVCTCHFSKFSIADGSVDSGPAQSALEEFPVTVDGSDVLLS